MPPQSNQAVIVERLESLKCDISDLGSDVREVVTSVKEVATSLNNFKVDYEKRHGELVKQTEANTKDIVRIDKAHDELETSVQQLNREVNELKNAVSKLYSVAKWALGILSAVFISLILSLLGFLYALITHSVAIVTTTPIP